MYSYSLLPLFLYNLCVIHSFRYSIPKSSTISEQTYSFSLPKGRQYSNYHDITTDYQALTLTRSPRQTCLQAQRIPGAIADSMSFGNRMEINVKLPTRDQALADEYIKNPKAIVEATWDRSKCRQLNERTFLLIMNTLPLPGVDSITPEIEVNFVYDSTSKSIRMSSGNWTLRGTSGGVVKDSRFMQTFEISIIGQLSLVTAPPLPPAGSFGASTDKSKGALPGQVSAIGWVEYRVQGEKPNIFKVAPPFVLDATISIIKESVSDFAERQFTQSLLRSFRGFMQSSALVSEMKSGRK